MPRCFSKCSQMLGASKAAKMGWHPQCHSGTDKGVCPAAGLALGRLAPVSAFGVPGWGGGKKTEHPREGHVPIPVLGCVPGGLTPARLYLLRRAGGHRGRWACSQGQHRGLPSGLAFALRCTQQRGTCVQGDTTATFSHPFLALAFALHCAQRRQRAEPESCVTVDYPLHDC